MSTDIEAITIDSGEAHEVEHMLKCELADLHTVPDHLRDDDGTLKVSHRKRFNRCARLLRKVVDAQGNGYVHLIDIIPQGDVDDHRRLYERLTERGASEPCDTPSRCAASRTGGAGE
jgi:hypothetical protein